MKYHGIELQPITKPQIFDPPKELLVWDREDDTPKVQVVWGIAPNKVYSLYCVLSLQGSYKYCAEIPQPPQPKRATFKQLVEWLARGNGVFLYGDCVRMHLILTLDGENDIIEEGYKIRPFGSTEWLDPTLDNMGMEE